MSSVSVQVLAYESYKDQLSLLRSLGLSQDRANPVLHRLAKLCGYGKKTGNTHTQLLNYLGDPSVPPPFEMKIPIKPSKSAASKPSASSGDDPATMIVDFPCYLPHALFSWYYHNNEERFRQLFLGEATGDKAVEFWTELERRGDPRLTSHPMRRRRDWKQHAIPLSLHGDGVPVRQGGVKVV